MAILLIAALMVGAPSRASAQFNGLGIYLEEDAFYRPTNEDRNYTAGFGFNLAGDIVKSWHLDLPLTGMDRLTGAAKAIHSRQNAVIETNTVMFNGSAFTPDSLRATEPVIGDRPYASIVALTWTRTTVDANQRAAWRSELTIGALGLHTGRNIQRFIHKTSRAHSGKAEPVDPKGWSNQISEGGEPTMRYAIAYDRLVTPAQVNATGPRHFEITAGLQGDVGYYTMLGGSVTTRLGRINSKFWEFRSHPLSGISKAPGTNNAWDLFLIGAVRPTAVLYNALLQGQFRDSKYTLSASQLEPVVLEYDLGATAMWAGDKHAFQLTILYPSGRTAEFRGPYTRTHQWTSVFVSFR